MYHLYVLENRLQVVSKTVVGTRLGSRTGACTVEAYKRADNKDHMGKSLEGIVA